MLAVGALGIALAGYVVYGWAALVRVGALDSSGRMVVGLLGLAALWATAQKRPLVVTCLLLGILPLFGNHPGGRYMEFVNLPLAASAGGLIAAARRSRLDPPSGPIWWMAGLYLLTAVLATIPTLPSLAVRAAQINDATLLVAAALTAAEDDPLYSVSSIALLVLAVVWAFAMVWAGVASKWAGRMLWTLGVVFLATSFIGIADHVGVTSLGPWYARLIDPRALHLVGLQSVFWHPAWFAWYFVVVFGLALGLCLVDGAPKRWALACGLAGCYLGFFLNPQRGGLIAIHVVLGLAAWDWIRRSTDPRRTAQQVAAAALVILAVGAAVYSLPAGRAAVGDTNLISVERFLNNAMASVWPSPDEGDSPSERFRLWRTALLMWSDAPAFGIGEGAFAWRYRDYVPAGSALDTPSYGDAHSLWFQLLATRGLAGAAVFACLLFTVIKVLRMRWRCCAARPEHAAALLGLSAFLTYSLVSALFYLQPMQVLFWLIVAIAAAASSPQPSRGAGALKMTVGCACLIGAAVQLAEARPRWRETSSMLSRQPRGFFPIDVGPFGSPVRWSSASGVLCLRPDATRVRMRFAVIDPRVSRLPRRVTLQADGQVVDQFEVTTPDVVTRAFALAPTLAGSGSPVPFGECTSTSRRLMIAVNRTWSPADTGFGSDPRRLGILVFEPAYLALQPASAREH